MSKIVFYYGSMNSSKSAQLIMTLHNFRQQGKKALVFKSSWDTRDEGVIKSRALNTEIQAIPISFEDKYKVYGHTRKDKPDFVFIDEVQFLEPEQIEELALIVDELGIDVICYGLLTDFRGELFPASKKLVEWADSIREIKNQCFSCNNKANRNMRLLDGEPVFEGEVVQVGAEESYRSVCRKCYQKLKQKQLA